MDDLISRSALLQDIENCVVFSGRPGTASAELRGANKVTDRIKAAPAVDAVEMKHRYWDDSGRYKFPSGEIAVRCSECGCALHLSEYRLYNWYYCPCCGSKMDGERKENG